MPGVEALDHTIATIRQIQSIVRTMKALAAVSVYPCERALEAMRGYSTTIELGLRVVLPRLNPPGVTPQPESARVGVVIFGSDRGLCGRFNEDIVDFALATLAREKIDPANRHLLALGTRVEARLHEAGERAQQVLAMPGSVAGIASAVHAVLRQVDAWQEQHHVGRVLLFHNRQGSPDSRLTELAQLLPLDLDRFTGANTPPWPSRSLPGFSTEPAELFAALVRQYLFAWVFRACVSSLASEHANRLAAMRAAERNITEQLQELTTELNRVRQESITAELLEVVSGFEVLVEAP